MLKWVNRAIGRANIDKDFTWTAGNVKSGFLTWVHLTRPFRYARIFARFHPSVVTRGECMPDGTDNLGQLAVQKKTGNLFLQALRKKGPALPVEQVVSRQGISLLIYDPRKPRSRHSS
jgi:hypothetical protein